MHNTVKLHYANLPNMGDLLNVLILERCFGCRVERHSCLTGEMCAIGSCLGQYVYHGTVPMRLRQAVSGLIRPHVSVWGTGFINYSDCEGRFFRRHMDFLAVRGELTRRSVERMTGRRLDIPTGDAGILASMLLEEVPSKEYDIGIVPHICDLQDPAALELPGRYENACLINVKDDPLQVVRQIAKCRTLLSSSLHGLIVADSFGIPNLHAVFSDRPLGDGYKFDDYYSAYGLPHIFRDLQTAPAPSPVEIEDAYSITREMVQKKKTSMIACFPTQFRHSGEA